MRWRFDIAALPLDRMLSRILHVLEAQRVSIHSFAAQIGIVEMSVTFEISHTETKAGRIEALLYRLEGIDLISVSQVLEEVKT
jgi:hypothetical protein